MMQRLDSSSSAIRRFATLLLLLLHPAVVSSYCYTSWRYSCNNNDRIATATLQFAIEDDTGASIDTYDAEIIFHWGPEDTAIEWAEYNVNEEIEKNDSHQYAGDGGYYFGYSVTFEGAERLCDRTTITEYDTVWFENGSCGFRDHEGTVVPTRSLTTDPPTESPTKMPAPPPSSSPTKKPTPSPTNEPTDEPTNSPTGRPTSKPTKRPTIPIPIPLLTPDPTPKPTPQFVLDSAVPTDPPTITPDEGSERTVEPTARVTRPPTDPPTTPAPIGVDETAAPAIGPVEQPQRPSDPPAAGPGPTFSTQSVPSKMGLHYCDFMEEDSKQTWITNTAHAIRNEAWAIVGDDSDVQVDVVVNDQLPLLGRRRRRATAQGTTTTLGSSYRRHLQERLALEIEFTATLGMTSDEEWNATLIVASAFQEAEKREAYINSLKVGDFAHFGEVDRMTVVVNHSLVHGTDGDSSGTGDVGGGDANGATGGDNGTGDGNNNTSVIIAGVVGVVSLLVLGMAIAVYMKARKRREIERDTITDPANRHEHPSQRVEITEVNQSSTVASTALNLGVIEPNDLEQDDISTLGDPYFGEAANNPPESDNTVGEISKQQEYYEYGVTKEMDNASRLDGSTLVSSGKPFFTDDTYLEDSYLSSPQGNSSSETSGYRQFTIVAPAGKLGIVLDNPHGDLPAVYAIKDNSVLSGKARVGDLLLRVDEMDCRGVSAHNLSKFLSSRSQNPARTMLLARAPSNPL